MSEDAKKKEESSKECDCCFCRACKEAKKQEGPAIGFEGIDEIGPHSLTPRTLRPLPYSGLRFYQEKLLRQKKSVRLNPDFSLDVVDKITVTFNQKLKEHRDKEKQEAVEIENIDFSTDTLEKVKVEFIHRTGEGRDEEKQEAKDAPSLADIAKQTGYSETAVSLIRENRFIPALLCYLEDIGLKGEDILVLMMQMSICPPYISKPSNQNRKEL